VAVKQTILKVSNNAVIDASTSTNTDALEFTDFRPRNFSVIMVKDSTDGDPIANIEASADGTSFNNPYRESDNTTEIKCTLDETVNGFVDRGRFDYKYFRVKTVPNGTTTGTLSYILEYEIG